MRYLSLVPLLLAPLVSGHAGVQPALGVGNLSRNQVQRPNNNSPCGNVNVGQTIDSSQAVAAQGGNVKVTAINFNGGQDGSRQFTAKIDTSGTGKNFVDAKVTVNGNNAPKEESGTESLTVQLPAGTACTGGASGNKCILSMTSSAGFGNCIVVSTGGGGGGGASNGGNNNNNNGGNQNNNNGGNQNNNNGGNKNNNNGGNQNNNNGGNNNKKNNRRAAEPRMIQIRSPAPIAAAAPVAVPVAAPSVAGRKLENFQRRIHARDFGKRTPIFPVLAAGHAHV